MSGAPIPTIRNLARAGDTERAWRLFISAGLNARVTDPDTLTLKGRLFKDRGLKASGEERGALLREARLAYLDAAALAPATYPLINAATIAFLDGDRNEAAGLAQRVLAMLASGAHEAETPYWLAATRAEACLLLERYEEARQAIAEAFRQAPKAWEDHASTLRHFRLILNRAGEPSEWLDDHRPPQSIHYGGIIQLASDQPAAPADIRRTLAGLRPGFAFGALAAGADVMAAEALLEMGSELHIILPATLEAFRRDSVSPFGADWEARFDAVLASADAVDVLDGLEKVSLSGVQVSEELAMGLAIRQASVLETGAVALRIGAGERARSDLLDVAWKRQGLPVYQIELARAPIGSAPPLPSFGRHAVVAMAARYDARQLSAVGGAIEQHGDLIVARFPEVASAAKAAVLLAREGAEDIGLAYGAFDPGGGGGADVQLASQIATAGIRGGIAASRPAVLALSLHAPELRCENFGTIASAIGDISISIVSVP